MTEKAPETDDLIARLRSFDYFGRSREEQDAADALCREAATALEAAQARVKELQEHLEADLTAAYLVGQKAARREALEEAAKAIGDLPTGKNLDVDEGHEQAYRAVEALMEKPNENG